MKKERLLSVVIPTKNRYEYLKILIKALLANDSQEFELIIQDNSDDNSEFLNYIKKYESDIRFRYNHVEGWLSVIDNCDLAVSTAIGDYVCMLGDDDGILIEQSLELVKYLKKDKIGAAICNKMSYIWPDTKHSVWGAALSGFIEIEPFYNQDKFFDSQEELEKVCNEGAAFGLGYLPRVYHAFVERKKLIELKAETNTFFPGPSPDMANAIGLTKYIQKYIYIDSPIVISGHSKKSTGGQGGRKEHHGSIKEQQHLPKNTAEKWSNEIPFFWSGSTIYSESARRALIETNRNSKVINYIALYACCLLYEKLYRKEILKTFISNNKSLKRIIIGLFFLSFYLTKFTFERGVNFLSNLYKNKLIQNRNDKFEAVDIQEAIRITNEKFVFKRD